MTSESGVFFPPIKNMVLNGSFGFLLLTQNRRYVIL